MAKNIKSNGQVNFANQLRVIAFLSVVAVHWLGVFWSNREAIASYVGGAPIEGDSSFYSWIIPPLTHFNYGSFGVGLFFLISGFVIPFSINSRSKKGFLIGRLLRIYPTYIVGTAIMIAILYISRIFFNESSISILSLRDVILNMLLINNLFGVGSIDWINWTLTIEIKFYLICLLFYIYIRKNSILFIVVYTVASFLIIFILRDIHSIILPFPIWGISQISIDALKQDFLFVPFMLIGTLFYYHYSSRVSSRQLLLLSLSMVIAFYYMWMYTQLRELFPIVTINYIYSFVLFYICYLLKEQFKPNAVIDFLAELTYPFYVLHGIIGYALLKILCSVNVRYSCAIIIVFFIILLISYLLHITIEKWAINKGKLYK